ncbi:MAG: hypothetical protein WC596_04325 [Candidatus Shapirobacteria bacterium]
MAESKERLEPIIKENLAENKNIKDLRERENIMPKDVEHWLKEIKTTPIATPVNVGQQTVMTPTTPTNVKIQLPVTRTTFAAGFKKSISEAGRWLSIFLFRLIKIKKGNIEFKKDE